MLRAEAEAHKRVAYFLQTEDGIPPLQVRQLFEVGEGGYVGARPASATPVLFSQRYTCACSRPHP